MFAGWSGDAQGVESAEPAAPAVFFFFLFFSSMQKQYKMVSNNLAMYKCNKDMPL